MRILPLSFCAIALVLPSAVRAAGSLPTVDLGYEVHQAISLNEETALYNFSNIRYAQPPVGSLRFRAPQPPTGRVQAVQVGEQGRICPQAMPEWTEITRQFVPAFAAGNQSTFNYTQAAAIAEAQRAQRQWPAPWANPNNHTTEDCLFLDVVVPKAVFEGGRNNTGSNGTTSTADNVHQGAPVLVWLHGGAYAIGNKVYDNSADPSGLIKTSQANGSAGIIYVSINYRLGALGWLAGPSLQAAGGLSNAGLLDQRLALEWIRDKIHLFGGDPNRVTVTGGSAGGGSIVHHITARGGLVPAPFAQAITESAGWLPITSQYQQENATNTFLRYLNVSTIEEAQNASTEDVILANAKAVGSSHWVSFTYGPVVDGGLVPALPGISLLKGEFDHNVSVMTGHVSDEAPYFTPPFVKTDEEMATMLRGMFPTIQDQAVSHILGNLYPESGIDRTMQFIAETGLTCNTNYLSKAFGNNTYNYEFRVPPGVHGTDFPYIFYSGPDETENGSHGGVNIKLARTLQGYVSNFVQFGSPNGPGLPNFPITGSNSSMLALKVGSAEIVEDTTANERCAWLQKALYA
ncbi:hypothetical protein CkaCkLH20_03646 [Colletotrichum karsti]|uniref:Carboxylic ester hydrolase n=1 Tax=Colletotrichum karsti TaxID=1095194 RepID=A0A9P6LN14_9PEZI|nr:uncharacterized protein CkaCkLH20_03646 [Colletotrichum karsti]KAF9878746.1 hypothetical protein CkaCkLH20_03646 [Colletotrichum karsti]